MTDLSADTVIVSAALQRLDGYVFALPWPNRHHDVINHMAAMGHDAGVVGSCEQGFLASDGRFLDRKAAWFVAEASGQITRLLGGVEGLLFSENLW